MKLRARERSGRGPERSDVLLVDQPQTRWSLRRGVQWSKRTAKRVLEVIRDKMTLAFRLQFIGGDVEAGICSGLQTSTY